MATRPRAKQYPVGAPAATEVPIPSPAVGRRVLLLIQNTGANPGLLRIANKVRADGGDFVLAAGQFSPLFDHPDTCPNDLVSVFSTLGTTFAVLETVES